MTKLNSLLEHPNLKAFIEHGFTPKSVVGNQVCGYSIFSGSDKMYINPTNKMWDCKSSGKSGGFKTWIKEVVHKCKHDAIGNLQPLADDRGLLRKTLIAHNVGYNQATDRYILPVLSGDGKDYTDVKRFSLKEKRKKFKFMSTSGMTNSLFNQHKVLGSNGHIWLCEGEWDAMVMHELLQASKQTEDIVLAVSGGTTFKQEWYSIFKDRDVSVIYDNDKTGFRGQNKVHKALSMIVRSINYVHWGEKPDGFDVRDFYKENRRKPKTTFIALKALLENVPHPLAEEDQSEDDEPVEVRKLDGKFVHPRIVYKEYKQWLHLPDTTVIDVLYGSIIANRLPGDPLWLFLVAPSGATKTEFLLSISESPMIYPTTSMTPHSLISGSAKGGADPSLIPRLNNKILVIKDFTTILNMNQMAKEEIFGILRDAYDGKTEKHFGNGIIRSYNSLFGIIAGVTPVIDMYTEGQTALGERFLKYRVPVDMNPIGAIKYLRRAMSNNNSENDMRNNLKEIGKRVLSYDYKNIPIIPPDIKEKIMYQAYWTSRMRGTVVRNEMTQDQLHEPFVELGTRLTKQYTKLLQGIGMFRGLDEIGEAEIAIINKIGIDSIPANREKLLRTAYVHFADESFTQEELAKKGGIQREIVRRHIKDLLSLNILKQKGKKGLNPQYVLHAEFMEVIENGEIYS